MAGNAVSSLFPHNQFNASSTFAQMLGSFAGQEAGGALAPILFPPVRTMQPPALMDMDASRSDQDSFNWKADYSWRNEAKQEMELSMLLYDAQSASSSQNSSVASKAQGNSPAVSLSNSRFNGGRADALSYFLWGSDGGWSSKATLAGLMSVCAQTNVLPNVGLDLLDDLSSPLSWVEGTLDVAKLKLSRASTVFGRLSNMQAGSAATANSILDTMQSYNATGLFADGQYISESDLQDYSLVKSVRALVNARGASMFSTLSNSIGTNLTRLDIASGVVEVAYGMEEGHGGQAFAEQTGRLIGERIGLDIGEDLASGLIRGSFGVGTIVAVPIIVGATAIGGVLGESAGDAVYRWNVR